MNYLNDFYNILEYLYYIINGHLSCSSLLELTSVPFYILWLNSCLCPTFHELKNYTYYGYNNYLDRMFRECNKIDNFDFFIPNSLPALRHIYFLKYIINLSLFIIIEIYNYL